MMNTPFPANVDNNTPREICSYTPAAGLLSIHTAGSHCEEAANIAGNLCFRQGFSSLTDLGIDDLTHERVCSQSIVYPILDPMLAKGFLWGGGFMRTKYVLLINNLEGFVERRPNPEYFGDDLTDTRNIKIKYTDPEFSRLSDLLNAISIDTMTSLQCDILKNMLSKPLQNLQVIMIDEMSPHVEFTTRTGTTLENSPCVTIRNFFPKFQEAVDYMTQI